MTFNTAYDEGLLVYAGPSPNNIVKNVTDFLSIELKKGKLTMLVNFGSKPKLLNLNQRVDDSKGNEFIIFTGPVERFWSYMDSTFMLILKPPGLHSNPLFKVTKVLKGISFSDKVCLQNSEGTWQSQATLGQLNSTLKTLK